MAGLDLIDEDLGPSLVVDVRDEIVQIFFQSVDGAVAVPVITDLGMTRWG